jgi:hypothetical protein
MAAYSIVKKTRKSRRDDTLLTVCFSLRRGDLPKPLRRRGCKEWNRGESREQRSREQERTHRSRGLRGGARNDEQQLTMNNEEFTEFQNFQN